VITAVRTRGRIGGRARATGTVLDDARVIWLKLRSLVPIETTMLRLICIVLGRHRPAVAVASWRDERAVCLVRCSRCGH
jgi:hypothetical protein